MTLRLRFFPAPSKKQTSSWGGRWGNRPVPRLGLALMAQPFALEKRCGSRWPPGPSRPRGFSTGTADWPDQDRRGQSPEQESWVPSLASQPGIGAQVGLF